MMYLISQLWVWLLLALIIGLVVGWLTCSREPTRWWVGWVPWGTAAFLIGLVLAVLRVFPDRAGYLLDTALLMFASYIIGCCVGCLIKQWLGRNEAVLATAGAGASVAAAPRVQAAPVVARPSPAAPAVVPPPPPPPVAPPPSPAPVATSAPAPAPVAAAPVALKSAEPTPVAVAPAAAKPLPPQPEIDVPAGLPGRRPRGYATPLGGKADDLKRIRGIGKQNEGRLHALGIWHFRQIADWVREEVEWVGSYLAFPGRIDREAWVSQAKILADGGDTDFSKRVDRGEVATSVDHGNKGQENVADLSKIANAALKPKT